MKTKIIISALFLIALLINPACAQDKKKDNKATLKEATIWVNGNCGQCKLRIETTAKSVSGVKKAKWDVDSKKLVISYYEDKTNVDAVEKAIVKVGHDTEKLKATDDAYNVLPQCCQYERKK